MHAPQAAGPFGPKRFAHGPEVFTIPFHSLLNCIFRFGTSYRIHPSASFAILTCSYLKDSLELKTKNKENFM
jgi:hypothetical protein